MDDNISKNYGKGCLVWYVIPSFLGLPCLLVVLEVQAHPKCHSFYSKHTDIYNILTELPGAPGAPEGPGSP